MEPRNLHTSPRLASLAIFLIDNLPFKRCSRAEFAAGSGFAAHVAQSPAHAVMRRWRSWPYSARRCPPARRALLEDNVRTIANRDHDADDVEVLHDMDAEQTGSRHADDHGPRLVFRDFDQMEGRGAAGVADGELGFARQAVIFNETIER